MQSCQRTRYNIRTCSGTVASILRDFLNEDVVEKLIRHEGALSGFETTSEFKKSRSIRAYTVP